MAIAIYVSPPSMTKEQYDDINSRVLKAGFAAPEGRLHHSAFGTQIFLGILTVLSGIAIWLAVLHQATGALVLATTVWGAHHLGTRDQR